MTPHSDKPQLKVLLCSPRGFCAGVVRAIDTVEQALAMYGKPVYVRHEIVHNRHVVDRLKAIGAVFVEDLAECPSDRPVVFSAHGVPKTVPADAQARRMLYLDATCPLVSKVHVEAERHYAAGNEIVLIGHAGHLEVLGTMGQLPPFAITLIETAADAEAFQPQDPTRLAFITQTTLSVEDTANIVAVLQRRFPSIAAPHKEDICYATTTRQDAIKALARQCDLVLVVGSANSSNSVRLVEVAERAGAPAAYLIDDVRGIDWAWFDGVRTLGLTAGASAPEVLVEGVMDALHARFEIEVDEGVSARETVTFKLPKELAG